MHHNKKRKPLANIKRVELYKELPLETPYSLHIFSSYRCNFRCNYCLHSLPTETLKQKAFKKELMSFDIFKKAIDDLLDFPKSLKALIFAGHGEPLLQPEITEMVAYAKEKNIAERVEIVTNASLLSNTMADKLIKSGLDRLKISIQGIDADKYKKVSGINIDFNEFISNIKYFYEHKTETDVYIKIIDVALENIEQEDTFCSIFSPICDHAAVEYAIPFIKEIEDSVYNKEFTKSKQGSILSKARICSMPFYMMAIEPSGNVVPCCSTDRPISLGNINKNSLKGIWESEKLRQFLRLQLEDKDKNITCKSCSVPAFGLQDGDYLDGHEEVLLMKY